MKDLNAMLVRLVRDEEGAAASEYAILVALIAAAVAAAVALFDLGGIFTSVSTKVKNLITGATT
jgi:Flp pilus assembly pilin Flp